MNILDEIRNDQRETKKLVSQVLDLITTSNKKEQYYNTKEAAKLLGVHEQTIRNAYKDGRIEVKKIGKRIVIHTSEIERLLSEYKSIKYKRD